MDDYNDWHTGQLSLFSHIFVVSQNKFMTIFIGIVVFVAQQKWIGIIIDILVRSHSRQANALIGLAASFV